MVTNLMDFWFFQYKVMKSIGNKRANEIWEKNMPPTYKRLSPDSDRYLTKDLP